MKPCKTIYDAEKFDNIRDLLNNAINKYPDNIAFITKKQKGKEINYKKIKYSEFQDDMNCLGTALIGMGYKDKRVAVIGKNSYEWALTFFSVLNGVGIIVPLDKGLPEEEIEISLKRSKTDVIVFDSSYTETMKKFMDSNNNDVKEYICMESNIDNSFNTMENVLTKGKELLAQEDREYLDSKIDSEKMCTLLFTSGTTSMSKAVMLSHKNIVSNIYGMALVEKFYDSDVNMAFLPFHHTFGSTGLLVMLSNGVTNVFCDGLRYIQANLAEYNVSVFVCVPLLLESMYKKIMAEIEKQGKTKLIKVMRKVCNFLLKFGIDIRRKVFKQIHDKLGGKLRFVISGASGLDKEVAKGFNDFGILTVQGYGLTETAPVLCAENETAIKYGSCGFPLPNVKVKIDNPNEDGTGEIIAQGPNVMLGYYENQEATREVIIDGWFHTGDLGYIDKDGFIFITGRKKNVIVLKNGKNIYPEELELLVNNLPYVAESMVFGKPKGDDLLLSAKIVYNEEYVNDKYPDISGEKLKEIIWEDIKNINKGVPNYKHIKNIIVTSEPMIKTTTAKIKRFEEIKKEENV